MKNFQKKVDAGTEFQYYVDMIKHINNKDYPLDAVLDLFRALNDPVRQKIIMLFRNGTEFCVTDIAGNFKISRPTVSHHLNLMKRSGVLKSRKDGKEVYYSFNKEHVIGSLEMVVKYLRGCC